MYEIGQLVEYVAPRFWFADKILTAFIAFGVGYFAYKSQHKFNNQFNYKNKVDHLFELLKDTTKIVRQELMHIKKRIDSIKSNPEHLKLPTTTGDEVYKLLKQRAEDEDYFTAFVHVFKNQKIPSSNYSVFRYTTALISTHFENISEMNRRALDFDSERKRIYGETWTKNRNDFADYITGLQVKKFEGISESDKLYLDNLIRIVDRFFENAFSKNSALELNTIHQDYVLPVKTYIVDNQISIPAILTYFTGISELDRLYKDIIFQNNKIMSNLESMYLGIESALIKLEKFNEHYSQKLKK
jgi:hypothetical protein